ncbi:polysaccharide deacetylase family protein [Gorillibacterium massiliense]|uniref:polysaccharide deacetylase family protein n=1 Tax=Gorillibacterium massiliense TaxID=1280390 RepID=UPI0004B79450|nr:polysaccharide deacetylase family protein [Gorillibacterium massiliense]
METYSTQVMELLSLRKTFDGGFQIKVVVSDEDRQAAYVIDIDEFTFLGLEALQPLTGGRTRLSPYPKWDPYRNAFYSAVIRTTGVSRDTLYFACSEEYINKIKQIRETDLPLISIYEEGQGSEAKKFDEKRVQFLPRFALRALRMANLLLIIYGLLAVLSIPSEGKADPVSIISDQIDIAQAVVKADESDESNESNESVVSATKNDLLQDDVSIKAAAATRTTTKQASNQSTVYRKDYEVIDIGGEKKFFGLPKNYVALTFDDGPSPLTHKIVDILTEHKVAATFLFVGKNVERNPEAVTYASEHGMSIGNHSWDHSVLTKNTAKNQSSNLSSTSSLIESLTHNPVTLFRPPYGEVNDELVSTAKLQHMKTLLWNRDPEDWNAKKPEDIVRYFHEVEPSGGVYVLHEDKYTAEALPAILDYLKKENLTFVVFK